VTIKDLARGLWPFVLLLVFLGTFRRGEPGAAVRDAVLDSTDIQRLIEIADGYQAQGRADLAEAAYRSALTVDPRDGDVHVRLGELLLKRGDRTGAHAEAESALRWHPASASAVNLAARSAPSGAVSTDQ
jgi:Flp pilus assembly protein TadD